MVNAPLLPSAAKFQDAFDLDGDVAGERAHADGAAGGPPPFTENVDHQFAESVDDLRVPLKVGDTVHHAEHFQHAPDAVEAAELRAKRAGRMTANFIRSPRTEWPGGFGASPIRRR